MSEPYQTPQQLITDISHHQRLRLYQLCNQLYNAPRTDDLLNLSLLQVAQLFRDKYLLDTNTNSDLEPYYIARIREVRTDELLFIIDFF